MARKGSRRGIRRVARMLGSLVIMSSVGTLLAGPSSAVPVAVGYKDHSYAGTVAPTAEKPQSKLWFNDGVWWGVLWQTTAGGGNFYINKFDVATQSWINTNVLVDPRGNTHMDVLSDGAKLYVASSSASPTATLDRTVKFWQYTYNTTTKTYAVDTGFPVNIADGQITAVAIAKDGTGSLWATFVLTGQVMVTHNTAAAPQTWVAPYLLPVGSAANALPEPDGDEAAIVQFDGNKVGIMFSNQNVVDPITQPMHMYWATHTDGTSDQTWTLTAAYSGIKAADDHINLKALPVGDPAGKVLAAAKTSQTGAAQTLTHLLVLKGSTWTSYEFGKVSDDHTRPIVQVDIQNRVVHVFAESPCCIGGAIYHKQTSLDAISFPPGLGTPFIQSATDTHINNPTSTKQLTTNATGLLVAAGDDFQGTAAYFHNSIGLTPPETTIDSGPSGTVSTPSATLTFSSSIVGSTFSCKLDSAAYAPCGSPKTYSGLANGSHTFLVLATGPNGQVDATPASRSWTVQTSTALPTWYLRNALTTGPADAFFSYGAPSDIPLTCDWNGDGVSTPGVYRNGTFYLRNSNTSGVGDIAVGFGNPGDIPVCGDWNHDGTDTIGVYRNGTFYLRNSNTTGVADVTVGFGNPTDVPVVGDWNGDGTDTIGVYRSGTFYLRNTNTTGVGDITVGFGNPTDRPLVGDWNGDHTDTVGVYRNGTFYLRNTNTTGSGDMSASFGNSTDWPIVGDWNGDAIDTIGVVRRG